ncbi:MAG: GNAT family N-acetyltransferase [Anaerolineales bacterium]|nr:GNAT family N-acetyltransferase [Anaerolineales bacterium]
MLTYKPATSEQYDEFFQLMLDEAADYLERTMELMQMNLEQGKQLFKTVGKVYGVYQNDGLAGFYWIEERDRILHLHGIVLRGDFQRKGIGTEVLTMLETEYRFHMESIELGVHQSNERVKMLYEKLGYRTVNYRAELGFYIMQKHLQEKI